MIALDTDERLLLQDALGNLASDPRRAERARALHDKLANDGWFGLGDFPVVCQ